MSTPNPSKVKRAGAVVAGPALAAVGVVGLATPAAAAWNDCSSGYNCWWSSGSGGGHKWSVAETNANLSSYNIYALSGYNRNSALRACGYSQRDWTGTMNYSRPSGDTESFSGRWERSNKFVDASSCPAAG